MGLARSDLGLDKASGGTILPLDVSLFRGGTHDID